MVEAEFVGDTPPKRWGDPGDKSLRKTMLEQDQQVNPKGLRGMTDGRNAESPFGGFAILEGKLKYGYRRT